LVSEVKEKDKKISKLEAELTSYKYKKDEMKVRYLSFEEEIKRRKAES
jgi:hypothetical protein